MRSLIRHALICIALIAPGAAMADGSFLQRPANCTAVMTIQKHGCEVETQLRCDAEDISFWRIELTDEDGPKGVSRSDQAYGLVEYQQSDGDFAVNIDPARSHMDAPLDMLARGGGTMTQIGTMSMWGIKKPLALTATFVSEPEALQMNGRNLHRFSAVYALQFAPPMPLVHGAGVFYFDAATGVLFEGEQEMEWPPSDGKIPHTPAAIILPGEPGFDEPHPAYDCGNLSFNYPDIKADQA